LIHHHINKRLFDWHQSNDSNQKPNHVQLKKRFGFVDAFKRTPIGDECRKINNI